MTPPDSGDRGGGKERGDDEFRLEGPLVEGLQEEHVTGGPDETEALGRRFAAKLAPGMKVALVGELGGGKTCFVRGVARGLGCTGYVKSPSFTLVHIYEGGRLPLYHLDLYRINTPEEFFESGLEEYVYSRGVSVIEWAEKVPELAEDCEIVVSFSHTGESVRRIEITSRSAGQ